MSKIEGGIEQKEEFYTKREIIKVLPRLNLRVTRHLSDELDHRRLVGKCRGMFDPCGDVSDSLVQTAPKLGAFVVFL